jgi:hypothetical protein
VESEKKNIELSDPRLQVRRIRCQGEGEQGWERVHAEPHRHCTAEHAARQPRTLSRVVQHQLSNPVTPGSQASRPHLPDGQGASCGRLDRGSQVRIIPVTLAIPRPRRSLRSHRPGQGENHVLFFKTSAAPAVCLRLRHTRPAFKPLHPAVRGACSSACATPRGLRSRTV